MFITEKGTILEKAKQLNQAALRGKDALHIACAISAGCKYFITTDDRIINKKALINGLILTDPIGFIREVYHDN